MNRTLPYQNTFKKHICAAYLAENISKIVFRTVNGCGNIFSGTVNAYKTLAFSRRYITRLLFFLE
jgi:hypothetical protein